MQKYFKLFILALAALLVFAACKSEDDSDIPGAPALTGFTEDELNAIEIAAPTAGWTVGNASYIGDVIEAVIDDLKMTAGGVWNKPATKDGKTLEFNEADYVNFKDAGGSDIAGLQYKGKMNGSVSFTITSTEAKAAADDDRGGAPNPDYFAKGDKVAIKNNADAYIYFKNYVPSRYASTRVNGFIRVKETLNDSWTAQQGYSAPDGAFFSGNNNSSRVQAFALTIEVDRGGTTPAMKFLYTASSAGNESGNDLTLRNSGAWGQAESKPVIYYSDLEEDSKFTRVEYRSLDDIDNFNNNFIDNFCLDEIFLFD